MQTSPTPINPTAAEGPDLRDMNLVARLKLYQEQERLTDSTKDKALLAARIGVSSTYVLRYLSNDFKGNLGNFEAKLEAFLNSNHEKVESNTALVADAFIVDEVARFLRQVKTHGYIGVGHGPAGAGKTSAARLWAAKVSGTIYIHANSWSGGRHHLTRAISRITGIKAIKEHTLDETLVARLTRSDRLIIIDNAQRLTESARKWLADFHDATGVPIALLGNPEIEKQWQRNDQHGSRVGLHRDVTSDLAKNGKPGGTAKATAKHLLRLHLPEATDNPEVLKMATQDLASFGACRAVAMRCHLAANILQGDLITDPKEAFEAAKTQLINAA